MAKPKLIILSGPLGSGKSTLAQRYVDNHAMALNLDIDKLRAHMGQWRDVAQQSGPWSKTLAIVLATAHLRAGYDVIVPQIYCREDELDAIVNAARQAGADCYELVIDLEKAEAVRRFMARGMRPGGLIDSGGGMAKVEGMYDELQALVALRPQTVHIASVDGNIDQTLEAILLAIKRPRHGDS